MQALFSDQTGYVRRSAEYTIPSATVDNFATIFSGSFFFFLALYNQPFFDRSSHIIALTLLFFVGWVVIDILQRTLQDFLGAPRARRTWIGFFMLILLIWIASYVGGVLLRLLIDPLLKAPRIGDFSFISLFYLIFALVVILCIFKQLQFSSQPNQRHLSFLLADEQKYLQDERITKLMESNVV
jgi:uncharacterized membrane protein